MAEDEAPKKKSGGCLGKLAGLLVLGMIVGLGVSVYFISLPQDLSDIGGASPSLTMPASPPRDMRAVLMKSIEDNYSVQISETELNQWLARELKLKQGGALAQWVTMKRVCVRLSEDLAEVIIERDIFGYPLTTSMFLQVEQTESANVVSTHIHLHGGGFHELAPSPTRGGRFGKLTVPQGFLILVKPDFQKIAQLFETEIDLGFKKMERIKIEDNRITFEPKQLRRTEKASEQVF